MNNHTISSEKNKFQILPYDIKGLIFDYLALIDFSSLALVCKDFNSVLQKNSELWARHMFRSFLMNKRKANSFSDEDLLSNFLTVEEEDINSEEMHKAKKLIIEHYYIRKRWKSFVENFYNPIDSQNFVNEIFAVLQRPSFPSPCVKKDVHYFLTNSIFQNFLTEIHFDIQGKSLFQDHKQTFTNEIAQEINMELFRKNHNSGEIHNLRWHLNSLPKALVLEMTARGGVVNHKSKKISKKSKKEDTCCFKLKRQVVKRKRAVKNTIKTLNPTFSSFQSQINSRSKNHHLQDFLIGLQDLIGNYCEMIFVYLRVLQDPYILLSEYTRLWNRFVLVTIDFNLSFGPFANLFHEFYDETYNQLPNFPEFSIWRFMVKIWFSKVVSNLSYYLKECFRSLLLELRLQERAQDKQVAETGQSHMFLKIYQSGNLPDALFERFFYKFRRSSENKLSKERIISLMKDFYQSQADLSYNEYTVFYWDCVQSSNHSPRAILENWLIQDTKVYYEYCLDYFVHDPVYFTEFLTKDCSFIEGIIGKTFGREVKKLKIVLFKSYLARVYNQILDEVGRDIERGIRHKEDVVLQDNNSMRMWDLSFGDIVQILGLHEKTSKYSEENRKRIVRKLNMTCPAFNNYLYFIKNEHESVESQNKEFEEIKGHRLLRGFMVPDSKFDCLFDLKEGLLTLKHIFEIGIEGRHIKEKLEDLDDRILFL